MTTRYTGGPPSARERLEHWLAPRGGTMLDGARLATINFAGIIVAMLVLSVVSLITRLVRLLAPLPFLFSGFFTIVAIVATAVFVWYRYAHAHGAAARLARRSVRPDVFGAVAATPFFLVALFLLSSGLFGLFFSVITFSAGRAEGALRHLLIAGFFLLLAAGNIVIARAASD